MLPMKAVRLQFGELIAADDTTLAPAVSANKIALIAADFALSEDLVVGDLTLATFTGSAAKAGATGAQLVGVDPATGQQVITIKAPAGGYVWECTADPGSPETIFGLALVDNAGTTLLGVEKFTTPVVISAAGEQVSAGDVQMVVVNPTAE